MKVLAKASRLTASTVSKPTLDRVPDVARDCVERLGIRALELAIRVEKSGRNPAFAKAMTEEISRILTEEKEFSLDHMKGAIERLRTSD